VGLDGWEEGSPAQRLTREGTELHEEGRQTRKAVFFPVATGRKMHAGVERAFEAMGVCLRVMQKKGASVELEEE